VGAKEVPGGNGAGAQPLSRFVSSPSHTPGSDREGLRADDVVQIVHDLRNPLATIALEASLLDHKLANGAYDLARSAVARIARNVEFLDRMTQDLLDSCSIDAGQFQLHRSPTELCALLEQVIDRMISTRDRGRVTLEATRPMTLSIDGLRIERVVANLIGNALKYAPGSSGIVVRLEAGARTAQVSVSDAGPGMTAAEMAYVFDKYRRVDPAHLDGRGLGLFVSKKIVEAHGGQIGVDSVRGAGSRFFFELPAG
jgi:signal transduction histidine kinase